MKVFGPGLLLRDCGIGFENSVYSDVVQEVKMKDSLCIIDRPVDEKYHLDVRARLFAEVSKRMVNLSTNRKNSHGSLIHIFYDVEDQWMIQFKKDLNCFAHAACNRVYFNRVNEKQILEHISRAKSHPDKVQFEIFFVSKMFFYRLHNAMGFPLDPEDVGGTIGLLSLFERYESRLIPHTMAQVMYHPVLPY